MPSQSPKHAQEGILTALPESAAKLQQMTQSTFVASGSWRAKPKTEGAWVRGGGSRHRICRKLGRRFQHHRECPALLGRLSAPNAACIVQRALSGVFTAVSADSKYSGRFRQVLDAERFDGHKRSARRRKMQPSDCNYRPLVDWDYCDLCWPFCTKCLLGRFSACRNMPPISG